jgi:hypothetical protein
VTAERYSRLAEFMSGWFHQDFDIEGETVAKVVNAYRAVAPPDEQDGLREDIALFLTEHSDDLDAQFERMFQPEVIPSVLAGSTRAFLETIRSLLGSNDSA